MKHIKNDDVESWKEWVNTVVMESEDAGDTQINCIVNGTFMVRDEVVMCEDEKVEKMNYLVLVNQDSVCMGIGIEIEMVTRRKLWMNSELNVGGATVNRGKEESRQEEVHNSRNSKLCLGKNGLGSTKCMVSLMLHLRKIWYEIQ